MVPSSPRSPDDRHPVDVPCLRCRQGQRDLRARGARVRRGGPATRRGRDPGGLVQRQLQGRPGDPNGRQGRPDQSAHPGDRSRRGGGGELRPDDRGGCGGPCPWLRAGRLAPRRICGVPARTGRLGRALGPRVFSARCDVDRDSGVHRGDVRGGAGGTGVGAGGRSRPRHWCIRRRGRDGRRDPRGPRLRGLGRDRQARRGGPAARSGCGRDPGA